MSDQTTTDRIAASRATNRTDRHPSTFRWKAIFNATLTCLFLIEEVYRKPITRRSLEAIVLKSVRASTAQYHQGPHRRPDFDRQATPADIRRAIKRAFECYELEIKVEEKKEKA